MVFWLMNLQKVFFILLFVSAAVRGGFAFAEESGTDKEKVNRPERQVYPYGGAWGNFTLWGWPQTIPQQRMERPMGWQPPVQMDIYGRPQFGQHPFSQGQFQPFYPQYAQNPGYFGVVQQPAGVNGFPSPFQTVQNTNGRDRRFQNPTRPQRENTNFMEHLSPEERERLAGLYRKNQGEFRTELQKILDDKKEQDFKKVQDLRKQYLSESDNGKKEQLKKDLRGVIQKKFENYRQSAERQISEIEWQVWEAQIRLSTLKQAQYDRMRLSNQLIDNAVNEFLDPQKELTKEIFNNKKFDSARTPGQQQFDGRRQQGAGGMPPPSGGRGGNNRQNNDSGTFRGEPKHGGGNNPHQNNPNFRTN